ncbi:UNVERIFIED_CONTAM: putative AC transposase [Sesamum latifolium]|uniref:AC transposase n=1 Tax=Sesamum latifolium TaxID=2727402 RepID=A0AAW2XYX8_9LAMI
MDVPNRWNSTYELLATALPLKEAFSRLQRIDKNYSGNPSESEWEVAGVVHECLQIFYEATRHFSGRKYPTSNIARDILAVPTTTVASEAAFSIGGRVIDESRTCLLPDAVEALVVADDWIRSIPKRIVDNVESSGTQTYNA